MRQMLSIGPALTCMAMLHVVRAALVLGAEAAYTRCAPYLACLQQQCTDWPGPSEHCSRLFTSHPSSPTLPPRSQLFENNKGRPEIVPVAAGAGTALAVRFWKGLVGCTAAHT